MGPGLGLALLAALPVVLNIDVVSAVHRDRLTDGDRVLLSLERLSGVVFETDTIEAEGARSDSLEMGFLSPAGLSPFSSARLGFGYASKRFTVDFGLGVSIDWDDRAASILLWRMGYLVRVTDDLTLWPRLGFGGATVQLPKDETGNHDKARALVLNASVDFAFALVPRIEVVAGPFVDRAVYGDFEFRRRGARHVVAWAPIAYGGQVGVLLHY